MALALPCLCTALLGASSLAFDASAAKDRPVTKVVELLKQMQKQIEKEGEEDEDIFAKMSCWCETNDREKTQSIKDATTRLSQLTTKIGQLSANSAQLSTEIKNHESEVADNKDALEKALNLRKKEQEEFAAEEKDMLQSIASLRAAVTVLGKHSSALQVNGAQLAPVRLALSEGLAKYELLQNNGLSPQERQVAQSFVQGSTSESAAAPSSEILGILSQMKETFETNLATGQKEETAGRKAYEELKAAKTREIQAGEEQIDAKTEEVSNTDEEQSQAEENLAETKTSLETDEEFMVTLKEKCAMTDRDMQERQKTRTGELAAISKTIAMLNSDEAHALFSKTVSFMQRAINRHQVAGALKGKKALSTISSRSNLDAFVKIKEKVEQDIARKIKQKADEVKMRDYCVQEFHEITKETAAKTAEKEDYLDKIDTLKADIERLAADNEVLKGEIDELDTEIKEAGESREKAHKENLATMADQRAAQKLLKAALGVMQDFYNKKAAALVQSKRAPPPGFNEYKKSAASGGVMGMIQDIITEAKTMEAEATRAEAEQQEAYEAFHKETEASIKAKNDEIVANSDMKGKKEVELVESKESLSSTMYNLEELAHRETEAHKECDFLLKNFEVRQDAFDTEIQADRKSIQMLSGEGQ